MEQVIGMITWPLVILIALAVMAGAKPDAFVKPLFSLAGAIFAGLFNLLGISVKSVSGSANTIPKPQPRYRKRPNYSDDGR